MTWAARAWGTYGCRLFRYVAVGIFNTMVFYSVFSFADRLLGIERGAAVTLAYAVSLIIGYPAHASVTFKRTVLDAARAVRFVIPSASDMSLAN